LAGTVLVLALCRLDIFGIGFGFGCSQVCMSEEGRSAEGLFGRWCPGGRCVGAGQLKFVTAVAVKAAVTRLLSRSSLL
jgi:hypothetical protein